MTDVEEFRRPRVCMGKALRELRATKSITQEVLSGRCGLHVTYISDMERGRRNAGWSALSCMVAGLGSTIAEFGVVYDRVFEEESAKAAAQRS